MTELLRVAELDPQLSARIVSRRTLAYSKQASSALDRPPFVRAASGICWFAGKLAIIQDDASFIALVDPANANVVALPLLAGHDGLRQFDKSRGNKKHKLDLECCFTAALEGVPTLFALGSGSKSRREKIVTVREIPGGYDLRTVEASALYALLNDSKDFSGSELNLEGAVLRADKLVLWQRGNGAARDDLRAVNATCEISFCDFVKYLDDMDAQPVPVVQHITQYDLGTVAGVPFTFTDATAGVGDTILCLASAEASPNTVDDGAVVGAAIGILRMDASLTITHLLDEAGQLCRDKVEGIVLHPADPSRAWVVMDPDDHIQPASLLEVQLAGRWH